MLKETNRLYNSVDELLKQLDSARGKTFYELDINHRLVGNGNKGVLGQIVEEGVFHYPINSDHNADFPNLNIELKTSGVVRRRTGISFKERVPLCAFDYEKTACTSFRDSYVWHKCEKLLFAIYEYLEGKPYGEMMLVDDFLHTFSPADFEVIKRDYEILSNKINSGHPELISESDTYYLSACTSGAGHGQLDVSASNYFGRDLKPRKFALKQSYMTEIIRRRLTEEDLERIISTAELREHSIEDVILHRLSQFLWYGQTDFVKAIGREILSKDKFERYVAFMLGAKGKVNNLDEFKKANITLKTIRVEEDGHIIENMSFPAFSFIDAAYQDWEDSSIRESLINQRFLFVIFKKKHGEYVFTKAMFYSLPEYLLDTEGRAVFENLKSVLLSGDIVRGTQTLSSGRTITLNNFPKASQNRYFHVRPHAQDSDDVSPLPVADNMTQLTEFTKQSFWLDNDFIYSIINELDY